MSEILFKAIEIQIALFQGNPLHGGQELQYDSYHRADFGDAVCATYGTSWGLINSEEIEFPEPQEDWTGVTHVALLSTENDAILRCSPISGIGTFFDPSLDTLGPLGELDIKKGSNIRFDPNDLFIYGGVLACASDHHNQSSFVN